MFVYSAPTFFIYCIICDLIVHRPIHGQDIMGSQQHFLSGLESEPYSLSFQNTRVFLYCYIDPFINFLLIVGIYINVSLQ